MLRAIAAAAPGRVAPIRAFVYCKRDGGCADAAAVKSVARFASVEITNLPNVGRCDHTYLAHARRLRSQLADVTLFLKDTTLAHGHLGAMVNVLGLVATLPADLEVFCARSQGRDAKTFELPRYESEQCRRYGRCYGDESYLRADVRPWGEWVRRHFAAPWPEEAPDAPTCLGGAFAAGRDALLRAPSETYAALEAELSRGNSLEAGHFMERAWLPLLGVTSRVEINRRPPLSTCDDDATTTRQQRGGGYATTTRRRRGRDATKATRRRRDGDAAET